MKSVEPYLNFDGNTLEAFEFYRSVFGGEFNQKFTYADLGGGEPAPEDKDRIGHIGFEIAPGTFLMGSDVPAHGKDDFKLGTNVYINLNPESMEEAKRLFDGLSAGGRVEMELAKTGWADLYASFFDKFGVAWMINYNA
ncbi:MAG TPA: VOC family protein [Trueperaceae bacterium]|nr:VOC family protein [Trueperaceae bacterium]